MKHHTALDNQDIYSLHFIESCIQSLATKRIINLLILQICICFVFWDYIFRVMPIVKRKLLISYKLENQLFFVWKPIKGKDFFVLKYNYVLLICTFYGRNLLFQLFMYICVLGGLLCTT